MKKACVFVDGENFRYSLKDLFPDARYTFRKGDYLPETDWHHFFSSLANQFECELLRTYWYVVEHIDCRPYRIPTDWKLKERDFARWHRERIELATDMIVDVPFEAMRIERRTLARPSPAGVAVPA